MFNPSLLLFWLWQLRKNIFIIVGISCRNGSHSDDMGTSLYDSQSGVIGRNEIHWSLFSIKFLAPPTFSRVSQLLFIEPVCFPLHDDDGSHLHGFEMLRLSDQAFKHLHKIHAIIFLKTASLFLCETRDHSKALQRDDPFSAPHADSGRTVAEAAGIGDLRNADFCGTVIH